MIRVAAVADVHVGEDSRGLVRSSTRSLERDADILLIAGDLTKYGTEAEAHVVVEELAGVGIPVACVLGNHDYHSDRQRDICRVLNDAGIIVLEGAGVVFDVRGVRVGVAGAKGFGGGFAGACATAFGEPEMKAFVEHTQVVAQNLRRGFEEIAGADVKVALLHYSPVPETVRGEPPEIFPFLGSTRLEEPINRYKATAVFHGHAHHGTPEGRTQNDIPVYNVSIPLLRDRFPDRPPFRVVELNVAG